MEQVASFNEQSLSLTKNMLLFEEIGGIIIPLYVCVMTLLTGNTRLSALSQNGSFTVARIMWIWSNTSISRHWHKSMKLYDVWKGCRERHCSAVHWSPPGLKLTVRESMIQCDLSSTWKHPICKYAIFKDTKGYRYPLIFSLTTCVLCL